MTPHCTQTPIFTTNDAMTKAFCDQHAVLLPTKPTYAHRNGNLRLWNTEDDDDDKKQRQQQPGDFNQQTSKPWQKHLQWSYEVVKDMHHVPQTSCRLWINFFFIPSSPFGLSFSVSDYRRGFLFSCLRCHRLFFCKCKERVSWAHYFWRLYEYVSSPIKMHWRFNFQTQSNHIKTQFFDA